MGCLYPEEFKNNIEIKCDLYLVPRKETATSSTGQTSVVHGMSCMLEMPLNEEKCRSVGQLGI